MSDQIIASISVVVGFVVLMAFCYLIIMSSIHRHKENKYDERQILARNQAYKTSYIFLLLYLTVCIALEVVNVKWEMFETMIFIGIFSSITIFAMICIFKQAYIFNDRRNRPYDFLIGSFLFGIIYLIRFFVDVEKGASVFTNGTLNGNIANLLFSILSFGMFIAKLIIELKKRSEADE